VSLCGKMQDFVMVRQLASVVVMKGEVVDYRVKKHRTLAHKKLSGTCMYLCYSFLRDVFNDAFRKPD
jgi:hypothetical protein